PFMEEYGFDPDWRVKDFVRGTLRLEGWSDAWSDIFRTVESLPPGDEGEQVLRDLSERLWQAHAYDPGEPDRVVLCVSLEATREGAPVWHRTYVMDAWGDEDGTAMGRLVSHMVAQAVRSVAAGEIGPGVSAAPSDPALVARWMDEVARLAQHLEIVHHA
ncbi:saccharopine dehydrogenase C-terminal domain-containing protein, partial [Rhodosalinus sp. FB01]